RGVADERPDPELRDREDEQRDARDEPDDRQDAPHAGVALHAHAAPRDWTMESTTDSRMTRSPSSLPSAFSCGPVNGPVAIASVGSPWSARSAVASRCVAAASAEGA